MLSREDCSGFLAASPLTPRGVSRKTEFRQFHSRTLLHANEMSRYAWFGQPFRQVNAWVLPSSDGQAWDGFKAYLYHRLPD